MNIKTTTVLKHPPELVWITTRDRLPETVPLLDDIESVKVQSAGPGAYVVSVAVEGLELSVKLDRAGARIHSVGV